jgi:hypothetical protein
MKYVFSVITCLFLSVGVFAQSDSKLDLSSELKLTTQKGDYVILEMRLNKEDEFRTMEGGSSSLARIAIYSGKNTGKELISKGFEGMNSVVAILNDLKKNGWKLVDVYTIKGESLIITHYIVERRK